MWHDDKYFFHLEASKREIVQIVPQSKIGCWKLYLESESVSYHWLKNGVCVQVLYEVAEQP